MAHFPLILSAAKDLSKLASDLHLQEILRSYSELRMTLIGLDQHQKCQKAYQNPRDNA